MDLDLDDFDAPSQPPAKTSRFAPKSRFQPKSRKPATAEVKVDNPPENAPAEVKDNTPLDTAPVVVVKKEEPQALSSGFSEMKIDGGGVEAKVEERESAATNGDDMELDRGVVAEEEEEDQIVAEYDVYCSPSDGDTKLFVLQYPLRPSWRPYDMDKCTEVRVKPRSAEVEVDLMIDVDDNFNADSYTAAKTMKQTLSTKWSPPQAAGYGVGVVMGKKLYLNPIHAVVQLRPSMEYLDSDSKKKSIPDTPVKAEGSSSSARAGPSRIQGRQMEPEVVEPWVSLKYHDSTHDASERCRRKMVTEEHNQLQFPIHPNNYLNSLCPVTAVSKSKPKGPSRRFLSSLPLEERLKTQLVEGPPIQRFNAIKHLVPDDPVEEVLQVLQKYAQLIQGLWVAKTAVRCSNASGTEALARDYVLLKLSESPVIKDSELDMHLGSRKSFGKTALREIAVERTSCKDWKFKEPKDISFMKLYPHVVEQQEKLWQDRRKEMEAKIPKLRDGAKRPENMGKVGPSAISGGNSAKATNGPRSSRMSMPKETREALPKALGKIFQTRKVCSFQTICQALRENAVSVKSQPKTDARGAAAGAAAVAAALSVEAPQEELHAAICEVAEHVNGVYLVKSSADHPELNPLRSLVIELFRVTPDGKLKKGAIIEAAKMKFNKEPTNTEFQKVITEYCVSKGGGWVLKNGDGIPI